MFGWFQPRCPIDVREKVWTEQRLQWMVRTFGLSRLLEAEVILPTKQYFPEPFESSGCDAGAVLDRVCEYMKVDRDSVQMVVDGDQQNVGLLGTTRDESERQERSEKSHVEEGEYITHRAEMRVFAML